MTDPFGQLPEPELLDLNDPNVSRDALQRLGADVWDEALDWLFTHAARRPTAPDSYPDVRRAFFGPTNGPAPAPAHGKPHADVLAEFRERLAPFTFAAQNPRSYSYFTPPPLPMAIAGETLAQWLNQGIDVWLSGMAAPFVEEEVIRWLGDVVGLGESAWGLLTSGGVMANIMGLAVARDVHLRELLGVSGPPRGAALEGARVYASDQAHFSIARGLDLLGFPREALRIVASDDRFRLRAQPVAAAIADDRAAGLTPLCISPVAGSTNTGSVDDLADLADLAAAEGLWLHVDAAYGGAARLSPREATKVPALERADSITIDPHKWLYQPYDIGGLLVRRAEHLRATFHGEPEYYRVGSEADEPLHFYQYSLEGTRRFRALKLWLSWKHLGTLGFGRLIEHDVDLAKHLAMRCRELGDFEVVEPELSVVCFRHVPPRSATMSPERLDDYQRAVQRALEVSGDGWVSTTTLRGRIWLRAGIVNYTSTPSDADHVLAAIRDASERVLEQLDLGTAPRA